MSASLRFLDQNPRKLLGRGDGQKRKWVAPGRRCRCCFQSIITRTETRVATSLVAQACDLSRFRLIVCATCSAFVCDVICAEWHALSESTIILSEAYRKWQIACVPTTAQEKTRERGERPQRRRGKRRYLSCPSGFGQLLRIFERVRKRQGDARGSRKREGERGRDTKSERIEAIALSRIQSNQRFRVRK